jgi:hypothetical protein
VACVCTASALRPLLFSNRTGAHQRRCDESRSRSCTLFVRGTDVQCTGQTATRYNARHPAITFPIHKQHGGAAQRPACQIDRPYDDYEAVPTRLRLFQYMARYKFS